MTFSKYFSFAAVIFSLGACSGGELVQVHEESTSSFDEVKTVLVNVSHHGTADGDGVLPDLTADDGSKVFQNDLGITITLSKAGVSWGHFDLISAGDDPDCGVAEDERLHVETIEDLLTEDGIETEIASEIIPDSVWCRYRIELTPDNEESLAEADFAEMENAAIYVAGTWESAGQSGAFAIAVREEIAVEGDFISLRDGVETEHPFHFHSETGEVVLENVYDAWFDGMDFSESEDELAAKLKSNVEANLREAM